MTKEEKDEIVKSVLDALSAKEPKSMNVAASPNPIDKALEEAASSIVGHIISFEEHQQFQLIDIVRTKLGNYWNDCISKIDDVAHNQSIRQKALMAARDRVTDKL